MFESITNIVQNFFAGVPWLTTSMDILPGVTGFTTSWFEIMITAIIAVNVIMCAFNTKWNWPIGLVAVTMYGTAAGFLWGLYADAWLQVFYFLSGLFGMWYWWKGGDKKSEAKTTDLTLVGWITTLLGVAMGSYIVQGMLVAAIPADAVEVAGTSAAEYIAYVSWMDAFTTVTCVFAQILLMTRNRSNWVLWIAANLCYIPLFFIKGLNLLAVEYFFFLGNAVWGFIKWSRDIKAGK